MIDTAAVRLGAKIGYYSGDVSQLTQDVAALKPSVFAGVPRVFQKIYDGINAGRYYHIFVLTFCRVTKTVTDYPYGLQYSVSLHHFIVFEHEIRFCLKYLMLYFGMTETPLLDKLVQKSLNL